MNQEPKVLHFTSQAGNQMLAVFEQLEPKRAQAKLFNVTLKQYICTVLITEGNAALFTDGSVGVGWWSLEKVREFIEGNIQ